MVAVILYFSIVSSTRPGSKCGSTTIEPPVNNVGMKNAAPACDNGVQMRKRVSAGQSPSINCTIVIAAPLRYVLITPLGLPVGPPVYARPATSSPSTCGARNGGGAYVAANASRSSPTFAAPKESRR